MASGSASAELASKPTPKPAVTAPQKSVRNALRRSIASIVLLLAGISLSLPLRKTEAVS
jgi:hypothetical protein